jgi:hypothetical protein
MEMNSIVRIYLYEKLPIDKIKINRHGNLIPMKMFLSFLTVPVKRRHDHVGNCNGWTLLVNTDVQLKISGGMYKGKEYLDSLQYGKNMHNPYNNYVNPFFLFNLLNKEGKKFFVGYYADDIDDILEKSRNSIMELKQMVANSQEIYSTVLEEVEELLGGK